MMTAPAISAAINNAERASQVVNVAEGGLQEISSLLVELQSLVGENANEAGVSGEEKAANQLQIDSILQTIDRVANSTSFNGVKLLNGNFDYTTSNVASRSSAWSSFWARTAPSSREARTQPIARSSAAGHRLNVTR